MERIVGVAMPFFENAGDYVPDFSMSQIHLYQSLLRQKAEITRQVQALVDSVPKVPRPQWHCLRCDHRWNGYFPRKKPKFCTNCQSRYWDRERVKSMDAVRSRKVSREVALNPIVLPKSLASVTGMTPPPVFNETDDELKALGDTIAAANKIPVRNRFVEDIVSDASGGQPSIGGHTETATVQESDEIPSQTERGTAERPASGTVAEADDEGPKCCSKPLIVDGFCLSCGDGLAVKHD